MPSSVRVIGRVARDPQLRRLQLGFLGFAIAEHGTWLAGIMYAFERGGIEEASIVAVVLLAPSLVVAPIAAFAADRFESRYVLATGYTLQSVFMVLVAVLIAVDVGSLPVYACAMFAATSVTLTRPAASVVLPNVTRTPADLTAANVVLGFVEYTGMFIGPALTGILVGVSGLAAPFAVCGGCTAVAAVLALGLQPVAGVSDAAPEPVSASPFRDTKDGLVALREHRGVRMLIGVLGLGSLVIGAVDVLFVVTADHLSAGETDRAGLFGTAFGVGAVAGSAITVALVGRARLTPAITVAVAAMGLSLVALASAGSAALAVVLFFALGSGESVLRISAATLIQRVAPTDLVGRFFGVAEGLHMFSISIGSGAIGLLIGRTGYERGLIAAGVGVTALLLVSIARLFRVDRDAVVPDERVLEVILGDDIFGCLPAPTIERLAADVVRTRIPAGDAVVVEGRDGDQYFVIDVGTAAVTVGGVSQGELGPGAGFGELALLRDQPRAATVVATTDLELLAFERNLFLQAVTGHARSAGIGRERTERYLGPLDG